MAARGGKKSLKHVHLLTYKSITTSKLALLFSLKFKLPVVGATMTARFASEPDDEIQGYQGIGH